MGRIIRRTTILTITQTWTIVWTTDDTSVNGTTDDKLQPPATTIVLDQLKAQDQPKPQEEADETILPAITTGAATDKSNECSSNEIDIFP